MRHLWKKYR